ncbi:MAG: hypothetical protein IE934_15570 [Sphingopyxis sp.]|nr:hypothetical protein [Sphingopyxis sp.]
MFEKALHDIRVIYEGGMSRTGWGGCIRKEDVLLWSEESGLSIKDTFDQVGIGLARGYLHGTLDWDFCDEAANDLFGILMGLYVGDKHRVGTPSHFWKFYLAFDYSETVEPEQAEEVARIEIDEFLSEVPLGQ